MQQGFCVLPAKPVITANGNILTSSNSSGNQWLLNGILITGPTGQTYSADISGIYSLQVTGPCGAGVVSEPFELNITGIDDEEYNLVRVFPNPAHERLTIAIPPAIKIVSIRLLNSTGKIVSQTKNNQKEQLHFNVYNLPKGMYLFHIETQKNNIYKKVLIQ